MYTQDLALRLSIRGGCRRGDGSERSMLTSYIIHSIGKLLQHCLLEGVLSIRIVTCTCANRRWDRPRPASNRLRRSVDHNGFWRLAGGLHCSFTDLEVFKLDGDWLSVGFLH